MGEAERRGKMTVRDPRAGRGLRAMTKRGCQAQDGDAGLVSCAWRLHKTFCAERIERGGRAKTTSTLGESGRRSGRPVIVVVCEEDRPATTSRPADAHTHIPLPATILRCTNFRADRPISHRRLPFADPSFEQRLGSRVVTDQRLLTLPLRPSL